MGNPMTDLTKRFLSVQDALAFERVGIARYARSERLLNLAPLVLRDRWEEIPVALRQRWVRCLKHLWSRLQRMTAHTPRELRLWTLTTGRER